MGTVTKPCYNAQSTEAPWASCLPYFLGMESIEELLKTLDKLYWNIYSYTCQIDHYADLRDSATDRKLKILSELAARYDLRNTYDFRTYLDEHRGRDTESRTTS